MLTEKLKKYQIILASASPRRKSLLEGMGFNFKVELSGECDEEYDSSVPVLQIPEYLAKKKSIAFSRQLRDDEILVTADTMVFLEDKILGKPKTKEEAFGMLRMLSGKTHKVLTGVYIRTNSGSASFTSTTSVTFKTLTDQEIEYYIENYSPYDKAGAYGAQEWIGYVAINRIEGSYFNVMGLPVHMLYNELERLLLA